MNEPIFITKPFLALGVIFLVAFYDTPLLFHIVND